MSYFLPHLPTGWHVDQAILSEEDRVVILRFGHDTDPVCMEMDETLYKISTAVQNFAVIYLVDITQVPDFNKMYELYDACSTMFFYRNKHIMIDLGTGNNNKINWAITDRQELIDIVEVVYRGASKGRGLVISPKAGAVITMVKVKLRVPLSSAPRETSSPLANPNPLRSAPDYSDDDEAATPLRDGGTPDDNAEVDGSDAEELDEDQDDDEDQEDELDELDELEGEDDEQTSKAASTSALTKRRSITLKSRPSKGGAASSSASPSAEGSASPHSGSHKLVKRSSLARMAQVQSMSVEELDALPAAKRRKTAKARGAAGPGRGWRKGLTKGQKPVYELPPAERTPATFGNTASVRSSPASSTAIKAETPTPAPITVLPRPKPISNFAAGTDTNKAASPLGTVRSSIVPTAASSSIKIVSGPGGQTFTGDLSAKAGTAKNPGFRYPPLPSSRAGPPVQPIARIPTAFQTVVPLERNARQPRRWVKAKREILSMGGRPWSIPVFYGGEDLGYEKKIETAAGSAGANTIPGAGAAGGAEKVVSKAGTPSAAPAPAQPASTSAKAVSPTPTTPTPTANTSSTPTAAQNHGAASTATTLTKASSPLPPPKHLNGLDAETNWRGQSPAFLFGGR
ncbi:hypothetical protein PHSY_001145 [Pseudozyma hubeiensis SY62]|uniref:Uncharacterized protein n=1 Tax=Pseudozyma hubeiensis (strain SY62) TaxID=1305764 RepID=R9P637_PSEHS|nr:hypothetical protein PHSY_001145 [Pseudozyma hubeiensis SY62]GAC93580.1 hypothetical protein PHSY_001145 [Pseudozyma hubeiensis SY62]